MKDFARSFYTSQAWDDCRKAYRKSVGGLCEVCRDKGLIVPGVIVHHKRPLTPDNINDPNITMGWDNLQFVCRECHAEIHGAKKKRYKVDEMGRVIPPFGKN